MEKRLIIALNLLILCLLSHAQGLRFKGMEAEIDKRTSMTIPLKKTGSCKDSLKIDFDVQFYSISRPGNIFELETDKKHGGPQLSLFHDAVGDVHNFAVIWKIHKVIIDLYIPKTEIDPSLKWMQVSLKIDSVRDSIYLKINNRFSASGYIDVPERIRPQLTIGKAEYMSDIPTFSIRKLKIDIDGRLHKFDLMEDSGALALSENKSISAKIDNPLWLANEFSGWNRTFDIASGSIQCAGYDEKNHEVYIINRDSIIWFNPSAETMRSSRFENENPVISFVGGNFIDHVTNRIYTYEAASADPEMPSVSYIDLLPSGGVGRWTAACHEQLDMQLHHHDSWLDTAARRMYVYGGFGNRRFNGSFLYFDLRSNTWSKIDSLSGDSMWPRYFSGMCHNDSTDKLYVYGGMGNESGNQQVGRKYLYDFHEIDLKNKTVRKLWEIDWPGKNNIVARNMVADPAHDMVYALCYPESMTQSDLMLYSFSTKDGSFHELGDKIPIYSDRITTNANLFYDDETEKLIAIVVESRDDIGSKTSVYTISYPPKQKGLSTVQKRTRYNLFVIGVSGTMLLTVILTLVGIYRRKRRKTPKIDYIDVSPTLPPDNSILLFGDFTATNRSGEDVTAQFTGKLKQLFLIELQHYEDEGLNSKQISSLLWPYKEEDKAKNIRGVTISYLRKLLKMFDGISLVFEDGKFKLLTEKPFYCDFIEFHRILLSDNPKMDNLIKILARGRFLPSETDPLFDKLKDDVDAKVEPIVSKEMSRRFKLREYKNVITCTDILFGMDPLNEQALSYCLRSYNMLKMPEKATARYREFITRYKKDYSEAYNLSYEEVCNRIFDE